MIAHAALIAVISVGLAPIEPSPMQQRREKRIELLTNLARGLGFRIEPAPYGKVAIVADAGKSNS